MLGEAVNNWGQGPWIWTRWALGRGPWAVDPSRLQVSYASRSVAVMLPTSPTQVPSSAGREQARQLGYFSVPRGAMHEGRQVWREHLSPQVLPCMPMHLLSNYPPRACVCVAHPQIALGMTCLSDLQAGVYLGAKRRCI